MRGFVGNLGAKAQTRLAVCTACMTGIACSLSPNPAYIEPSATGTGSATAAPSSTANPTDDGPADSGKTTSTPTPTSAADGDAGDGTGVDPTTTDAGSSGGERSCEHVDAAQVRTWSELTLESNPVPQRGGRLIYDGGRGDFVYFGGQADGFTLLSQTWAFDGAQWTELCDPCPPGARWGAAVVYQTSLKRILLFGGRDSFGDLSTATADLWAFEDGAWVLVPGAPNTPSPRSEMFAAYDERRERLVIFGGRGPSGDRLSELYEYDGNEWFGPIRSDQGPSARSDAGQAATFVDHCALDPAIANSMLLFGGTSGKGMYFDDAWAWDGTAWTLVCNDCTQAPRTEAALVYDAIAARPILQGGFTGGELAGTWHYDLGGWQQFSEDPTGRDSSAMAHHAATQTTVLFGGNGVGCSEGPNGFCGQTWVLQP